MATLPRSSGKSAFASRPISETDFDSGINSSAAWTESNKPSIDLLRSRRQFVSESDAQQGSLSDEEVDEGDLSLREEIQSARALYTFEGKPEFRELNVEAGDEIDVLKVDVGEGWSLVRKTNGEIGLLPQTYYTVRLQIWSPCPTNRSS